MTARVNVRSPGQGEEDLRRAVAGDDLLRCDLKAVGEECRQFCAIGIGIVNESIEVPGQQGPQAFGRSQRIDAGAEIDDPISIQSGSTGQLMQIAAVLRRHRSPHFHHRSQGQGQRGDDLDDLTHSSQRVSRGSANLALNENRKDQGRQQTPRPGDQPGPAQ